MTDNPIDAAEGPVVWLSGYETGTISDLTVIPANEAGRRPGGTYALKISNTAPTYVEDTIPATRADHVLDKVVKSDGYFRVRVWYDAERDQIMLRVGRWGEMPDGTLDDVP
jgi:hypothetical protein